MNEGTDQHQVARHYNVMAIISFVAVLSVIGGFLLGGIIGVVLGIISLFQIKRTYERGKGLAVAAIVIGLAEIVFFVFALSNITYSIF
jgi:hypothetical protein